MKPTRRSAGDASRLNRVASRRSSLRFGRNTPGPVLPVGAPPSRALSAGRFAGLGAHVGSITGCSPRRFAPLIVAFRSEYTGASSPGGGSSLTRLVSRAPRRPRRSRGFHHRLFTASLRAAHRCVSVGIHRGQFSRWGLLPHAPCQPGASPASALTWVPSPAVHRVASRRSSLRFGRNTPGPVLPVGAPPSRALSAGRLPGLGAPVGSTTGCSPLRFAPFCVAFRSEYTGYFSLTRLVSRAPRPHREDWPGSALTRVPPPAASSFGPRLPPFRRPRNALGRGEQFR